MILKVENLVKHYPVSHSLWGRVLQTLKAVDGVSFELQAAKVLGIVGESGCGKSTLGRALLGLTEIDSGKVQFDDKDLFRLNSAEKKLLRQDVQVIFQDPFSSLNPRLRVWDIIAEPFLIHNAYKNQEDLHAKVVALLEKVGLSAEASRQFPHEFSGGQRQRIGIARALALRPKLIVADEPVSALDVSVQSQILNLLKDLQIEMRMSMVFIAHDLAVVEYMSDDIAVMYLGAFVEYTDVERLFEKPSHPYTQLLLDSAPKLQKEKYQKQVPQGDVPSPINPPSGCAFHPRCPKATKLCSQKKPEWRNIGSVEKPHGISCHHV